MARRGALEAAVVFLAYASMTLWVTWPLFASPGTTVLETDHPWLAGWFAPFFAKVMSRDIDLCTWIFAWDWHALSGSPTRLFDANIFHPAPDGLAYSDHLLGHLVLTAPTQILSGNPVLAHQINLFLSFPLSGVAIYLLLRRWRVGMAAAFIAGIVYSLCPTRLDMIYHSHLLAGQYFVFALLFLDRAMSTFAVLDTALFGTFLCLSLLSSYYVAFMTGIGVVITMAAIWCWPDRPLTLRRVAWVGVATAVAGSICVLLSLPYFRTKAAGAITDYSSVASMLEILSNDLWKSYCLPPRMLKNSTFDLSQGMHAYLGLIPFVLVTLSFFSTPGLDRSVRNRARMVGIGCIVLGYVIALGPQVTIGTAAFRAPYAWAMEIVPGFSAMRVPGRFSLLLIAGWAILVGFGCDVMDRHLRRRRHPRILRWGTFAAVLLAVAFEYDLGGQHFRVRSAPTAERELGAYRALAAMPPGPVLELPYDRPAEGDEPVGRYMVLSTLHWHPLLNGSSGYAPLSQKVVKSLVRLLPDSDAQDLLARMTGVSYVILHAAETKTDSLQPWLYGRGLRLVGQYGDDWLFQLIDRPVPDLLPRLVACSRDKLACTELSKMSDDLAQSRAEERRKRRAIKPS
jgi:hypothetical protein